MAGPEHVNVVVIAEGFAPYAAITFLSHLSLCIERVIPQVKPLFDCKTIYLVAGPEHVHVVVIAEGFALYSARIQPATGQPQHSTLNSQSSTLESQPSILNHEPSILHTSTLNLKDPDLHVQG